MRKPGYTVLFDIEGYNVKLKSLPGACSAYTLGLELSHFMAPYTVDFVSAPAGFNPSGYNTQHPSFSDASVVYGTPDNPVPFGNYTVQVTDACGRTVSATIEVTNLVDPEVITSFSGTNGCSGTIIVKAPPGRAIVTAQLTNAPAGYAPVPQDLETSLVGGYLTLSGLIPGTYTITFTDDCNTPYTITTTIVTPDIGALNVNKLAGCGPDEGTINISFSTAGYGMQSAAITQAPAGFAQQLPYDVSGYIFNASNLLVDGLPVGNYHITTTDFCGNIRQADVLISGYETYLNNVEVMPNCGSFDISLFYNGSNTFNEGFWLQSYNEQTGMWGHPVTGAYSPDGFFAPGLAIALQKGQVNYNFQLDGQFRVVHSYFVYGNANEAGMFKQCSDVLTSFTFHEAPKIVEAYAYPCTNGLSEVVVYAEGVAPLVYKITQKNGVPFIMEGDQNVFAALEDATYTFTVTDACNNIVNRQYDITDLKPMDIRAEGLCAGEASSLAVREFSFLTYEWWYEGNPDEILSTEHELVFAAFDPETQAGTYYLKVVSVTPGSCIDAVVEYEVVPTAQPNSGNDGFISMCNRGQLLDLKPFLDGNNNDTGIWQDTFGSGGLNGSVVSFSQLDAGQYDFTYVTYGCNNTDEAVIHLEVIGKNSFPLELFADCIDGKYSIVISNLSEIDAAEILWTGPIGYTHYGDIADINGLRAGVYTATVTNASGCISRASIDILATHCFIPRGISPGDSSYNNNFDLSNLGVKHLTIFNRFGMQVYEKDNYRDEWYGQSDKGELPAGTYFYVINLTEGKQVTGWVYLLRKV